MNTRRKCWLGVCVGFLAAVLVFDTTAVLAQSYDPDQTIPKPTMLEKRLTKLGRGISNILFGWAEIPLTLNQKLNAGKPLAYLIGVAPVLGTTRAFMRTGVGIYEIVTFATSKSSVNYEAILEPEYIF